MATRNTPLAPSEFYHVYNRGVDKRTIYETPEDHIRFQQLLYVANSAHPTALKDIRDKHQNIYEYDRKDQLVAIGAYCLMPNHFHILLTPLVDSGISKFMGKVTTGYSMYFNKKHARTGRLFEGAFKAKHADSDEYLKYLFAYIHLNPVKLIQSDWKESGITDSATAYDFVNKFKYSSYTDYQQSSRAESQILSTHMFPEYFKSSSDREEELLEWLSFQG
jgi:putative transposase